MRNYFVGETDRVSSSLRHAPWCRRDPGPSKAGLLSAHKKSVFKSPVLARSPGERVLETYSGRIEGLDKETVYLTLAKDGEFFEGEFAKTTFTPGAEIIKGRGTITEKVALPSGQIVWRNRMVKPRVVEPKILAEMRAQLDAEFDGTSL